MSQLPPGFLFQYYYLHHSQVVGVNNRPEKTPKKTPPQTPQKDPKNLPQNTPKKNPHKSSKKSPLVAEEVQGAGDDDPRVVPGLHARDEGDTRAVEGGGGGDNRPGCRGIGTLGCRQDGEHLVYRHRGVMEGVDLVRGRCRY